RTSGDGRPLGSMHSLVLTDITQWTECIALPNRGEQAVGTAIAHARTLLPMSLLGLDSDNGGEFINHHLVRYCARKEITFTRCRPYKKNDQCGCPLGRIEQKNYSIVRQIVGDDRYEGEAAHVALMALYWPLRLYTNYFQPSVRLVSKQRDGGKVTKRYDVARTPYERVLAAPTVAKTDKGRLWMDYLTLNPAALRREIEAAQEAL
ncbi:MAG: transposase, partial [Thermomicrobia bacterium]|nr:transposase [Thermomicrobia bacterium]